MCIVCGDTTHIDFESCYALSNRQRIELTKNLNIDSVIETAINRLYDDRKIDDATRKQLNQIHYEPLKKGVNEGFNQALKVEYGTPNFEFLKQLQTNTAVFAVFKNHAVVQQMASLLKDDKGNLRSREDFKKEALKLDAAYRGSKLDAEYDTAVRTARMAANWQKYEAKKKLYPNLRYMRTKANKPDANHLAFVGIVRPVDDPFWSAHYPPNRWRCQCSVEQTDDEAGDIPGSLPPVDPAFAFNSGKTGQIFDIENSDYIKSIPPKEQPALIKEAKKMVVAGAAANAPLQQLYKSKNGGEVKAHPLAFDNGDFKQALTMARALANEGKEVNLLPAVNDPQLRKELLPKDGIVGNSNPDYLIGKNLVSELKQIKGTSANTIKHTLSDVKNQCNNIVIEIPENFPFTKYETIKQIKRKMQRKEMKGFGEVWVYYKGEWLYNPHK